MTVRYLKPSEINHPLVLSDMDRTRIQAVLEGKLSHKWVSLEEIEAFHDELYDHLAADRQTVDGSLAIN